MIFAWRKILPASSPRRPRRMTFSWDGLEDRKVMSHSGGMHHVHDLAQVSSTTSTSSAVSTARATLQKDVQAIEAASSTTVAELSAIRTTFQTLHTDGLTPTSYSALSTFQNSLVTASASGTTLAGNATLLGQFEALYTSTPTTQQTTDLTAAYNALATAVTSSNITSANITTINADYAALLTAEGSTSTATYPYFNLVSGQGVVGQGHHGFGASGSC